MNTEWIDNLKAGDDVIISNRYNRFVCTVEKITPAGKIKANGLMFRKDGSQVSSDRWCLTRLLEATPEAVRKISEDKVIRKALNAAHDLKDITREQAVKILAVLEPNEWNKNTQNQFTDEEAQDLFGKESTEGRA